MNRGNTIFAQGLVNACAEHFDNGISTCDLNYTNGVSEDGVVNVDIPLSITVSNGDLVELGIFLQTSSLSVIKLDGQFASAESNFFNTVQWQGLVADSAHAGVTLASASGFDYGLSHLVSTDVHEPGTVALLSLGLLEMTRTWKKKMPLPPSTLNNVLFIT